MKIIINVFDQNLSDAEFLDMFMEKWKNQALSFYTEFNKNIFTYLEGRRFWKKIKNNPFLRNSVTEGTLAFITTGLQSIECISMEVKAFILYNIFKLKGLWWCQIWCMQISEWIHELYWMWMEDKDIHKADKLFKKNWYCSTSLKVQRLNIYKC